MSGPGRILVDADACPARELLVREARRRGLAVVMVCDTSHRIDDGYSTVIVVDQARDSADMRLANLMRTGDLVVTQDYGVAAMALGRGCRALHPTGMEYTAQNIDRLLLERHLGQKARRAGKRCAPVKKRTSGDDRAFAAALRAILDAAGPI